MHSRLGVLALGVLVFGVTSAGCERGQREAGSAAAQGPTLAPLPAPPVFEVSSEALPGSGEVLTVVAARPRGEAVGEARPTITFSRPVKSLEMVEAQRASDEAQPLARIEPALDGAWRWLGSASAEFVPRGLVPDSTTFTVTVPGGLTALDGARLAEDFTFSFSTPRLKLQDVRPVKGDRWVTPEATIALLFNQPVRAGDLEAAATLTADGVTVPLKVVKELPLEEERRAAAEQASPTGRPAVRPPDAARGPRSRQVRYTLAPATPLPLGSALTLTLAPELHGVQGPLPMAATEPTHWRTYGPMRVESASFCVGEGPCPRGPLVLRTTNGAELESLKGRLKVSPAVELDWDSARVQVPEHEWQMQGRGPTVWIPGRFKPGTQYTVELARGSVDVFKQAAADSFRATLKADALAPELSMGGPLGVIESTAAAPRLPVEVTNLESLSVRLWKLSPGELAPLVAASGGRSHPPARPPDFSETEALSYPRNEMRVHPVALSKVLGADAKAGLAFVALTSADLKSPPKEGYHQLVQVTDLAAHVKLGPKSSLAWVTRLSTGEPVAGAEVTVYDAAGTAVWNGTSDPSGFAEVPGAVELKLPGPRYDWEAPFALIVAQKDGDVSATASGWAQGVEPTEFGVWQGWEGERPESASFAFTDRGVYRPGDEVFVKGVVRYRVLGELRAPTEGTVVLTVTDAKGAKVKTEKAPLTRFGTFSTKLQVSSDGPTGSYLASVEGTVPGGPVSFSTGFRVEAYRAPQFRVDLEPAKGALVAGEPLEARVLSRYLFGGAMSEASVKWSVERTSTSFTAEVAPDFTFSQETWWWDDGEPHDSRGFFASGEGRADARGQLELKAGLTEAPGGKPYLYTLEAEVTDVNRQTVAGRAEVTVHPASAYVGLRAPSSFLQVGKASALETLVVDSSGQRVPGRKVEVSVLSRTWKSVKKKDASGGFSTVSEPEEKEVHRCELTSAEAPVPCALTPATAGFYIVRATVKDERGRAHSASLGVYATGPGWVAWQRGDTDRIELVADKASYDVGDVARVLVKSPYPKARALLTVEREGILVRRALELEGSVVSVEVPITEDMVPNVFASVLLVHPRVSQGGLETGDDPNRPTARVGLVKLNVERKSKRLAVKVSTDQKTYRPKDTVNVTVDVTDAAGGPASGEVTLYAVDEAVLRLTGYQVPDPIAAIFPERPLSVRLGEPLLMLVRQRSFGEKGEVQGGGGGEGEGGGFRNRFKTTALFNPTVALERGVARVSFSLPDNLTSFRLMAVAITAGDRFGSGETSLQVSKPVMALPALPRFARVTDTFEAGVVVHSHGASGEVTVTAQVEGGAELTGSSERKVLVAPGAPREVRFAFKAVRRGEAKFRFKVTAGRDTDGVQVSLPVELPVELEAVATVGDTTSERVEGLTPPKDVWEDVGGLSITLSSTALGGLEEGFQQLIEYPYGCLEQQSSRLVPFIALRELAGQFGVPWPGPDSKKAAGDARVNAWLDRFLGPPLDVSQKKDPDEVIAATVKSLLALQDADGSFRYWPDASCADSWTSAYATLALSRAHEVGFEVPSERLALAQRYLGRVVGGTCHPCERGCGDETRVLAAYVLARAKRPRPSAYPGLYARRAELSLFGRALLADAMHVGGGDRRAAAALMEELLSLAKESPQGVHLEEVRSSASSLTFQSDTRTTGAVLQALTDIAPTHPFVGKLARHLGGVRRGSGEWRSTQEAAWSLMGLTEVLRTKEKDAPDFTAAVAMGGGELLEERFSGRSLAVASQVVPMKELLAKAGGGAQRLTFKKDGAGVLYYSALLRYAPRALPVSSLDSGLFVQRWFEPFEGGGQATRFVAGELVRVRVRVATHQQRHWVALELPLPAGLEAVDTSLSTTARQARAPQEEPVEPGYEDEGSEQGEEAVTERASAYAYRFFSPFTHTELRDDRILAFADHLPPGVHLLSFVARATTPGVFVLQPARGRLMYEPEVWGRSEGGSFEVLVPTPVSQK